MNRKWKIALFSTVGVLSLSLSMFTFFYFSLLHHYKGKEVVNEWHETDVFDINKVKTLLDSEMIEVIDEFYSTYTNK